MLKPSHRTRQLPLALLTLALAGAMGCGSSFQDSQVSGQMLSPKVAVEDDEFYGIGGSDPSELPPIFGEGTSFVFPRLIQSDDPSSLLSVTPLGQGEREVYDRRSNRFDVISAHLFRAEYSDGSPIEAQVNPEFDPTEAQEHAEFYARVVGQLPVALRQQVEALWIHDGDFDFGGGNRSLTIHVGRTPAYQSLGVLEEILLHEASHTSLDWDYQGVVKPSAWNRALLADGRFISPYAQSVPEREDIAESFVAYLALRTAGSRVPLELQDAVRDGIPARVAYFDSLQLDLRPMTLR